jgi:hypothetical protein
MVETGGTMEVAGFVARGRGGAIAEGSGGPHLVSPPLPRRRAAGPEGADARARASGVEVGGAGEGEGSTGAREPMGVRGSSSLVEGGGRWREAGRGGSPGTGVPDAECDAARG